MGPLEPLLLGDQRGFEACPGRQAAKRFSARWRRFAASTSRSLGGAELTSASSSVVVADVTWSTARSKASAFA
jgi:hypothetical protein